jgi:hypothetical protein
VPASRNDAAGWRCEDSAAQPKPRPAERPTLRGKELQIILQIRIKGIQISFEEIEPSRLEK